jgi:geranylgeranyl pyrophosphate synthase
MIKVQKTMKADIPLKEFIESCSRRLKEFYPQYLQNIPSLDLKTAMEYSLLNGGKHLRPLLIYAAGSVFNAAPENLDVPAAAVELIHTYSLIHDDLPCMDNADLRRGKPTSHKMYGEGIAVLTGDALHTLAMQIMAHHPATLKPERRLQMINVLTASCGPYGMAAGQALDITMMNDAALSTDLVMDIYRLKTGALFSACIELGRLASKDNDEVNQRALKEFGDCIGLAFQIQDDILDVEASTEELGKPQGIDVKNKKDTYPHLVGLNVAKEKVEALYEQAFSAINYLGHQAQILRELATYMLQRKN